ncbi:MAG: DUF2157 domain-containing protein [Rhodothermia bacterium]|nr:DUF2157 domain-containing protein [Rhodothermia bacterium]
MSVPHKRWLAQEMKQWQSEGWFPPDLAEKIQARYQFDQLKDEGTNRLLLSVYTMGALIVGMGVVTFVAANWEAIPAALKLVLLFAAMLTAHGLGFYLWKISETGPRLGHALVLLGTLIFAANIGLIAQIFHIRGNWYNGFGASAVGALAAAYALRSIPNAVFALVCTFVYGLGLYEDHEQLAHGMLFGLPLVFIPLVVWEKSVAFFTLTALAWMSYVILAITHINPSFSDGMSMFLMALQVVVVMGLVLGHLQKKEGYSYSSLVFALIVLLGFFYFFGFREIAEDMENGRKAATYGMGLLAFILPVLGWFFYQKGKGTAHEKVFQIALIALLALGFSVALLNFRVAFPANYVLFLLLNNAASVVLGGVLLYIGYTGLRRGAFWIGLLYLFIIIGSRFFEYTEDLTTKALVFVILGVALIFATFRFEKYLKTKQNQEIRP